MRNYDETIEKINSGKELVATFKSEVSKELIEVCGRLDAIKAKFREFGEKHKVNECPLLAKGLDFYANHLSVDVKAILDGLNDDIKVLERGT